MGISFLKRIKGNWKKKKIDKSSILYTRPQIRGICERIFILKPRKPNSAKRKVVKVHLGWGLDKVIAYIPGEGHNLTKFKDVLLWGGRIPDLPGIWYKVIWGTLNALGVMTRKTSKSKYGVPILFKVYKKFKAMKRQKIKENGLLINNIKIIKRVAVFYKSKNIKNNSFNNNKNIKNNFKSLKKKTKKKIWKNIKLKKIHIN